MVCNICNNCDNIGNNLVLSGALIAMTLAKDLTIPEQDLLGNFLQVIAQNLLSMSSAVSDCKSICENTDKYIYDNGSGPGQKSN